MMDAKRDGALERSRLPARPATWQWPCLLHSAFLHLFGAAAALLAWVDSCMAVPVGMLPSCWVLRSRVGAFASESFFEKQKVCVRTDRAARCCVCRQLYSVQPRVRGLGWRAWARLRYLMAAAAVTLLAFGLSGPPWPHVAVLLLLMLGVRSHSLLAVLALALACVLAVLHARGLRCATLPNDGPVCGGTVDAIADAVAVDSV